MVEMFINKIYIFLIIYRNTSKTIKKMIIVFEKIKKSNP